jgi:transcriptional regulator with XRE-family HTH domain
MTIGEKMKIIRKSKSLTQRQLATLLNLSEMTIRRFETNERKPKISTLEKIARFFEVDICYFFGKEEKHAKWLINCDGYYPYCSNCKTEPPSRIMTKYCPNCGARMDLEE